MYAVVVSLVLRRILGKKNFGKEEFWGRRILEKKNFGEEELEKKNFGKEELEKNLLMNKKKHSTT